MTLILYKNHKRAGELPCPRSHMTTVAKQQLSSFEEVIALDGGEMVAQYRNVDGIPCKAVLKSGEETFIRL